MTETPLDPRGLCQIEIEVSDLPKALHFYEHAFGWRPVPAEMHELVVLEVPPGCPFGISLRTTKRVSGAPNSLVPYFQIDDPESLMKRVESSGGRRLFGPTPLPGYGTIYQCTDPDGTRLGLFTRANNSPAGR